MSKYRGTIGLEIHAELNTNTKMFCDCKNDPDEDRPNVNICPICLGHPGTLPVINKEAVKHVLKIGSTIGGTLASRSEFDRKNYFYPDIPKDYQISQYKHPLVFGGELSGVQITRVHLEEDTGTSSHDKGDYSLINFNRAGVPLMELVTEPVIHLSSEAGKFARELQSHLQYLGVAEANMEKGEMRVEANVSVSNNDKLGTKVEVKNLNSFKVLEKAIEFEIQRQTEVLERGERVVQETRGWDESKQSTYSQREKEDSHDYRYFPDPDLPKLNLSKVPDFDFENLKASLPEMPNEKRKRFSKKFAIKDSDIEFYINNRDLANFFEKSAEFIEDSDKDKFQLLSNYIINDVASMGEERETISPQSMAELIAMVRNGEISSRGAKDTLSFMSVDKSNPREIAINKGFLQETDNNKLEELVNTVISQNKEVVGEYKAGKVSSLQFLIGQGMKLSKGSANPELLKDFLRKKLS